MCVALAWGTFLFPFGLKKMSVVVRLGVCVSKGIATFCMKPAKALFSRSVPESACSNFPPTATVSSTEVLGEMSTDVRWFWYQLLWPTWHCSQASIGECSSILNEVSAGKARHLLWHAGDSWCRCCPGNKPCNKVFWLWCHTFPVQFRIIFNGPVIFKIGKNSYGRKVDSEMTV